MDRLLELKKSKDLHDLAALLGYSPSGLSYILYKIPSSKKYRTFTIPKKYGGSRTIEAPTDELNALQRNLSQLLYSCVEDIGSTKKFPSMLLWIPKKQDYYQ